MAILTKILVAAAAVFAVSSAKSYEKCYKKGERCIGAPGKAAVPYFSCCDTLECSAKDTSYGGYGFVCAEKSYKSKAVPPKCYKEGERCIGAPGKAAVPYLGCCDGMECSAKDTSYGGYGLVCANKGYKYKPVSPKCYKEGERCIGAPGKAAVPYLGCCDGMECSAKDTSYGGYGLVCAKKGYKYKPVSPKCYKEGERCIGAPGKAAVPYLGCCDGMECSAKDTSYGGYGLVCAKKGYKKPAPKCIAKGEECKVDKYAPKCCGYSKCVKGYGKYSYACGDEATTVEPTTTAEVCLADGMECTKEEYSPSCCGECIKGYGDYKDYAFVCANAPTTAPPTTEGVYY